MTDHAELIARLRYYHKPNDTTIDDACNAIEAQAAEIERLTANVDNLNRKNTVTQGLAGEAQAERDTLRAQLAAANDSITFLTEQAERIAAERDALQAEVLRLTRAWEAMQRAKCKAETSEREVWNERETLRAQLAAAQGQEPVAEVRWAANIPNSILEVKFTNPCGLPVGTKLYTAPILPQPAQRLSEVIAAHLLDSREKNIRCVKPLCCPKCHALWLFWPKEQSGFETDTLSVKSSQHCNFCENAKADQLSSLDRVKSAPFAPDWSQGSAAAEVIREHQAICNLLLKEMRHIAGISTGQVKRVAEQALESVKQAQPEPATHDAPHYLEIERSQGMPKLEAGPVPVLYSDTINGCMVRRDDVWLCTTPMLSSKQAQPERAPLSLQEIADAWGLKPENIPASDIEAVREIEAAHAIKQGGQHD